MSRSRRILILSEPYPPRHPGGAGKFARTLAQGLSARGHLVDVVCSDPDINETLLDGDVQVHRVRVVERGWTLAAFNELYDAVLPLIQSLHKQKSYDLLHDVGGFLYADVFRAFILSSGIPGITHLLLLMSPYLTASGIPSHFVRLFHNLQQLQCGVSKAVITTSSAEQRLYRKLFKGVPADQMVSNGVDVTLPTHEHVQRWRNLLSPDGTMLLFVGGRLGDRVKGNDRAVALLNALQKRQLQVQLVGTSLRPTNSGSTTNSSIRSVGRLTDEELPSLLAAVDVVLCPSRYEAFGLLAIEALAVGTPVLAASTGGYLDTVGRVANGLLLSDDDWQNPRPEIIDFLRNCSAEWMFPRSQPTLPEDFTREGVLRRIEAIYDRIIEDQAT